MKLKDKLKGPWTKKKISILLAFVLIIPLALYGLNSGFRIFRLYQTVHEPIDDEQVLDAKDSEHIDPDEVPLGSSEDDTSDPIEGSETDNTSAEDKEYTGSFPGYQDGDKELDLVPIRGENVWDYQGIDRPFYESASSSANSDHLNILLLGLDEAIDEPGRSDSIMIMRLNIETEAFAILSIPRDTYVQIPGHGFNKAGHAMAYGGTSLAKSTMENFLDISIDHYIRIDMSGFEDSVNALDGVTVDVPEQMIQEDGEFLFEEGSQHMDGEDALEYIRARKLLEGTGGDLGRIRRQQQVVFEMLQKIRSDLSLNETLSFMEDISPYIRTDIGARVIMNHWSTFNQLDFQEIDLRTLPGESFIHQDIYYFRVPIENARIMINSMAN